MSGDGAPLPPTRWVLDTERGDGYADRFEQLIADGEDVVGEARLADVLLPRGGAVLDAGSGIGRIGAELRRRGHRVVAAEPDPVLVARSRTLYPDLAVLPHEILELTPDLLTDAGGPASFDLVVAVGNVLTFVAEGTEVAVLARLRELLAPGGRVLVGFHLEGGPSTARDCSPAQFRGEVAAAGLRVVHHFGGYDLRPADDSYAVWVLDAPATGSS
ncbi:class I SAM-dependent methyltransferase [Nocardioides sp.]|uniref:class I SAM-dependent DNA methyltransferase n=1 Tax=Nocardioides sp. TaxID=35761 RepID=UPI003517BB12